MQNLRLCIECSKDHPEQLNRGSPDVEEIRVGNSIPDIVISVQAYVTSAIHGINSSLLNLPGLTGLYILSQLRYKCAIISTANEYPSHNLNVKVFNSHETFIQVTHRLMLTKRNMTKDVSDKGGSTGLAARNLDSLGSIKPYYGLVTDKKLKNGGINSFWISSLCISKHTIRLQLCGRRQVMKVQS